MPPRVSEETQLKRDTLTNVVMRQGTCKLSGVALDKYQSVLLEARKGLAYEPTAYNAKAWDNQCLAILEDLRRRGWTAKIIDGRTIFRSPSRVRQTALPE